MRPGLQAQSIRSRPSQVQSRTDEPRDIDSRAWDDGSGALRDIKRYGSAHIAGEVFALVIAGFGLVASFAWIVTGRGPLPWVFPEQLVPLNIVLLTWIPFGLLHLLRMHTRLPLTLAARASGFAMTIVFAIEGVGGVAPLLRGTQTGNGWMPALGAALGLLLWMATGGPRRAPFERPPKVSRRDIWRAVAR